MGHKDKLLFNDRVLDINFLNKYYTTDEEGAAVAPKYEEEFLKGLFYMERDYLNLVPEQYQEVINQGWVNVTDPMSCEQREFSVDGSVFQL